MLLSFHPTISEVIQGLIDVIHTDVTGLLANSYLQPVLNAYSVTLNTSSSIDDSGAYVGLFEGPRDLCPDGLSISIEALNEDRTFFLAPNTTKVNYEVSVKINWRDYPQNHLQRNPSNHRKFMVSLSSAFLNLLSPLGLGTHTSSWTVGGGTLFIENPCYSSVIFDSVEMQGKKVYFSDLIFTGWMMFQG